MNKYNAIRRAMSTTFSRGLVAVTLVSGAVYSAMAQEVASAADTLISSAQGDVEDIVQKVAVAGAAILLICLGLKILPFAYRKISGFFK